MSMAGYHLQTCIWELTLKCTYACKHCGSRAGRQRKGELDTAEALGVASQLVDIGCQRVVLIGGEVFLREDWDVIASHLSNGGVEVSIITNGSCLTDLVFDRMHAAKIGYIGVSVDGIKDNHDAMRMPGSFDVAMRAIEESKQHGLTVAVVTVLTSKNVGDVGSLYSELADRGVDVWQLQLCSPFGNVRHAAGIVPSGDAIADALSFIAEKAREFQAGRSSMNVVAADNMGYYTDDESTIRGYLGGAFPGCSAGLSVIGIDSIGNVRGCESLYDERFIEGNLRERTLESIWDDSNAFAYNRHFTKEQLGGKCKYCAEGCRCAAGCRSINYFTTGNMYESVTCTHA